MNQVESAQKTMLKRSVQALAVGPTDLTWNILILLGLGMLLIFITISAINAEAEESTKRSTVHVRSQAQLAGPSILLGAIADISAADDESERLLSQLILDESPAPGKSVVWSAGDISKRLRAYSRLLQNAQMKLPDRITIKRVLNSVSRDELTAQIEAALQPTMPDSGWQVKVTDLNVGQDGLELPAGSTIQVVPPTVRPRGAANFEILVMNGPQNSPSSATGAIKHEWITGKVKYFANVATLARQIDIRTRITPDDVKWERKDVTALIETPASAIDMGSATARATLNAGAILTRNMLEREMALRFGEQVEISAGGEDFQVTMKGFSQQNGFIGDTVNVKNSANNKILTGTIVAKGVVQVRY